MTRQARQAILPADYTASARLIDLRYVTARTPGITRRRSGRGWIYVATNGKLIRNPNVLERIRNLVIPPAWTSVWICADDEGHLQACGTDIRGRRQYLYHERYRQIRDATKFSRMVMFGEALPSIRARVAADLKLPPLEKNQVLAAVVWMLDRCSVRIGMRNMHG